MWALFHPACIEKRSPGLYDGKEGTKGLTGLAPKPIRRKLMGVANVGNDANARKAQKQPKYMRWLEKMCLTRRQEVVTDAVVRWEDEVWTLGRKCGGEMG